jgi:hypothetical protein
MDTSETLWTAAEKNLIYRLRRMSRLRELDAGSFILEKAAQLVDRSLREIAGCSVGDAALVAHGRDLIEAAKHVGVSDVEPGTPLAVVVRENELLRAKIEDYEMRVDVLTSEPDPDDVELRAESRAHGMEVVPLLWEIDPALAVRVRDFLKIG